jgi:hypothetical protein
MVKLKMTKEEKEIFESEQTENIKKPKITKKKEVEKIVKIVTKKSNVEKEKEKIEEEVRNKEIIIDISTSIKYDVNWSYLKRKIKLFFILPYKSYENWFNKSFNTPKIYTNNKLPQNETERYNKPTLAEELYKRKISIVDKNSSIPVKKSYAPKFVDTTDIFESDK